MIACGTSTLTIAAALVLTTVPLGVGTKGIALTDPVVVTKTDKPRASASLRSDGARIA
jgi:hypothetical protein